VRFLDDGSDDTPTFSVQVDNGESVNHLSNLFVGTVNFTNDAAPLITAASFAVAGARLLLLATSHFSMTDSDATAITFTVSSVTLGTFQTSFDCFDWTEATQSFPTRRSSDLVRFLDDGSDDTPTFSVQVDNGESVNHLSNLFVGTVNFTNDAAPLITAASF